MNHALIHFWKSNSLEVAETHEISQMLKKKWWKLLQSFHHIIILFVCRSVYTKIIVLRNRVRKTNTLCAPQIIFSSGALSVFLGSS